MSLIISQFIVIVSPGKVNKSDDNIDIRFCCLLNCPYSRYNERKNLKFSKRKKFLSPNIEKIEKNVKNKKF